MAVAYGLFAIGVVLGWSALFLRASTWTAVAGQVLWLIAIGALSMLSANPWLGAAGALTGAIAHLLLQLGLEARRA